MAPSYVRARSSDDSDAESSAVLEENESSPKAGQRYTGRGEEKRGHRLGLGISCIAVIVAVLGIVLSLSGAYFSGSTVNALNTRIMSTEESLMNATARIARLETILKNEVTSSQLIAEVRRATSRLEFARVQFEAEANATISAAEEATARGLNATARLAWRSVAAAGEHYEAKLDAAGDRWAQQLNKTAIETELILREALEAEEAQGLNLFEESIASGTKELDLVSHKANDTAHSAAAKAQAAAMRATKTASTVESKNRAVLAGLNASASRAVAALEESVATAEARLQTSRQAVDLLEKQIEEKSQQVTELQTKVESYEASTESRFDKQNAILRSWVAGFFALSATVLTLRHVYAHATHMASPDAQRKVLAILWMVPIYALTSWAAIVWPALRDEFALISSFYEAYCIHIFFSLLVAVLSAGRGEDFLDDPRGLLGPDASNLILRAPFCSHLLCCDMCFFSNNNSRSNLDSPRPEHRTKFPYPDNTHGYAHHSTSLSGRKGQHQRRLLQLGSSCAPTVVSSSVFVGRCKLATLQFTIAKPALSILQFVFDRSVPKYRDAPITDYKKPTLWITLLLNASVSLALAGLFAFFHATQHNPRLIPHKPWPKFLAIKCVVFLTWLQAVLINGFFFSDAKLANAFQNFLVCVEMFVAALAHTHIFGAEEWQPNYIPVELAATSLADNLALNDFLRDLKSVLPKRYRKRSAAIAKGTNGESTTLEKPSSPTLASPPQSLLTSPTNKSTSTAAAALSIVQALRSPIASDDEDELSPQPTTRRTLVLQGQSSSTVRRTEDDTIASAPSWSINTTHHHHENKGHDTEHEDEASDDDAQLLPRRRGVSTTSSLGGIGAPSGETELIHLV